MACEKPKTGSRQLCGRRNCTKDYQALLRHQTPGRYHASSARKPIQETPAVIGLESATRAAPPWLQVAGAKLTPTDLRLATVGAAEAKTAANRANRRYAAEAKANRREAEAACLIQPHHSPVNLLGGYRFQDAPAIDLTPGSVPAPDLPPVLVEGDDPLAIPAFLVRTRPPAAGNMAAPT